MKKTIFSGFVLILAFTAASSLQAQTTGTAKAKTLSPELVGNSPRDFQSSLSRQLAAPALSSVCQDPL
jgi:hypothetical protein